MPRDLIVLLDDIISSIDDDIIWNTVDIHLSPFKVRISEIRNQIQ